MLGRFGALLAVAALGAVAAQSPPPEAFRRGDVHYRVSFPLSPEENDPHEEHLVWDETGVRQWTRYPKVAYTRAYLDHDTLNFLGKDFVRFSRERSFEYPGNPKYALVARKPSMALGVLVPGFPVVRREGDRLVEAADSARAVPFTRWTYEGSQSAGTGLVPRVATMYGSGQADSTLRFEILSARIGSLPPGERVVPEWYRPGMSIADDRVSPSVGWTYERLVAASGKRAGLTPDELYRLSQSLAAQIEPRLEAQRRREAAKARRSVAVWAVPVVVFCGVLAVGGIVGRARRRLA